MLHGTIDNQQTHKNITQIASQTTRESDNNSCHKHA